MKNDGNMLFSKRHGSALALVLAVLAILIATGTGMLSLSLHGRMLATRTGKDIAARSAADAGLTKALFEMNEMLAVASWDDTELPQATDQQLPNCDATFSYNVTGDTESGYTVESTGNFGWAERKINSTMRLKGLFDYGMLGVETISMENNNLVAGYNSDTGDTDLRTQMGTMSTAPESITLASNTTVEGDVFAGVGADPEEAIDGGTITGRTYALDGPIELQEITAPLLLDKEGTIDVQGTTILGPEDAGKYTGITMGNNATLQIIGDVSLHITGDIDTGNGNIIQITDGSSLTLYVDGNITGQTANNAEINNETAIPANFKLYLTGSSEQVIEFKNNSEIYGVIYAPNADVIFKNNTDFYGSIVAENITLKNNAVIYHDKALRNGKVTDQAVAFVVDRWGEQ